MGPRVPSLLGGPATGNDAAANYAAGRGRHRGQAQRHIIMISMEINSCGHTKPAHHGKMTEVPTKVDEAGGTLLMGWYKHVASDHKGTYAEKCPLCRSGPGLASGRRWEYLYWACAAAKDQDWTLPLSALLQIADRIARP